MALTKKLTTKEKFIDLLDRYMESNLTWQEDIYENSKDKCFKWEAMSITKIQLEILILFANDVLGRREVNKLCKKYDINNYDGGLPLTREARLRK